MTKLWPTEDNRPRDTLFTYDEICSSLIPVIIDGVTDVPDGAPGGATVCE
jgi:hypothetical protein